MDCIVGVEMIKKKRCLIYAYYDIKGILHNSTWKLLKEFREFVDYIFFVSNSKLIDKEKVESITNMIIIRDNDGFDAGAYGEVICNEKNAEFLKKFDEVILCNSSFWGPFIPIETLFLQMKNESIDFWGLAYSGKNLVHHVQSYFMVFCEKIINEGALVNYFKDYLLTEKSSYNEVCREFEIGLSDYLLKKGYKCNAYVNNICYDSYSDPYGSLKYDKLPILKKKVFSENFISQGQIRKTLKLIQACYGIDTDEILAEARELYTLDKLDSIEEGDILVNSEINQNSLLKNWDIIEDYVDARKEVYLLGCGYMMKQVLYHFFSGENNIKLAGIIAIGKLYDITKEELHIILRNFSTCSVLICVDDDEIENSFEIIGLRDAFNIWKQPDEYKNNIINISDTIITAIGKYYYYREPLAIVDDSSHYCGMLTKNEIETQYTFAEDTKVLAIANISIPRFTDVSKAKIYACENDTIVPVIDNAGKFIRFVR